MRYRELELTLLSARDLKNVNVITRMEVYAVVTISGDHLTRQCTASDRYGGRHPCWNATLRFAVPPTAAAAGGGWLHVLLRAERFLGDRDVGEVIVPLADLLAGAATLGPQPAQVASYQVRKVHRSEPRGVLTVSYRLGPVVAPLEGADKPPVTHPMPQPQPPVMAYPVPHPPVIAYPPPPPPREVAPPPSNGKSNGPDPVGPAQVTQMKFIFGAPTGPTTEMFPTRSNISPGMAVLQHETNISPAMADRSRSKAFLCHETQPGAGAFDMEAMNQRPVPAWRKPVTSPDAPPPASASSSSSSSSSSPSSAYPSTVVPRPRPAGPATAGAAAARLTNGSPSTSGDRRHPTASPPPSSSLPVANHSGMVSPRWGGKSASSLASGGSLANASSRPVA